jgi:DNA-binding NarL/FixJ family response regulator
MDPPRPDVDDHRVPRVYLCDDAREYRILLKAVLTAEEGLDVVGEGGDGGVCITDAERHDPDVVLLDVNMPGVSGMQALPRLREVLPEATIIMLSSAPSHQHEAQALRHGASACLQKPTNIFELPAMIRQTLAAAS